MYFQKTREQLAVLIDAWDRGMNSRQKCSLAMIPDVCEKTNLTHTEVEVQYYSTTTTRLTSKFILVLDSYL